MLDYMDKPLSHILFLTHVGEPGGAEYVMMRLCESVKDKCTVTTFEHGQLEQSLAEKKIPYEVIALPNSVLSVRRKSGLTTILKATPSVCMAVKKLTKKGRQHDIIVAMSQKSFFLACISKPFMRRPIIWFMNDLISTDHFSKPLIFLMTKVFGRFANRVVVNSQASYDAWIECGGNRAKTRVIYPGTDYTHIQKQLASTDTVKEYRARFTPNDAPLIGIFGRICDWKGQDIFLKALAQIENVNAVIVGEAFFDQEKHKQKLYTIIKEHKLENRVQFAGHLDDAPRAMAACDIIIHASTQPEPFGLVIVEALMCKKPIIASKAGGAIEIIGNDEAYGLLTPPSDVPALTVAIQRLLKDKDLKEAISQNGYERALKNFSTQNMIFHFKELLEEILN